MGRAAQGGAKIIRKIAVLLLICLYGCAAPRPWTKTEKAAAVFFVATHTFDAYTTERCLDHPDHFYEMNPILGRHPRDGEVIAYFSLMGLGALVLAHYVPDLRLPLLGAYGAVNTYWGLHNIRLIRDWEEEER